MQRIVRGLALAAALAATTAAHAEDASYPNRPVRVIVPFAAGGPPDVISRLVAQKLSERWRQQVYVENRPGAAGRLAGQSAVSAMPDGYTFNMMGTTDILNKHLYNLSYDLERDLVPITIIEELPGSMVVRAPLPANNEDCKLVELGRD